MTAIRRLTDTLKATVSSMVYGRITAILSIEDPSTATTADTAPMNTAAIHYLTVPGLLTTVLSTAEP